MALAADIWPYREPSLSAPARDVLGFLESVGASFLDEIVGGAGRLRAEVEDARAARGGGPSEG